MDIKRGDLVKLKSLDELEYNYSTFIRPLREFAGKILTIKDVPITARGINWFRIEEDRRFNYSEEWIKEILNKED